MKRISSVFLIAILLFASVFGLGGCENNAEIKKLFAPYKGELIGERIPEAYYPTIVVIDKQSDNWETEVKFEKYKEPIYKFNYKQMKRLRLEYTGGEVEGYLYSLTDKFVSVLPKFKYSYDYGGDSHYYLPKEGATCKVNSYTVTNGSLLDLKVECNGWEKIGDDVIFGEKNEIRKRFEKDIITISLAHIISVSSAD